jgi:hypothetical protein
LKMDQQRSLVMRKWTREGRTVLAKLRRRPNCEHSDRLVI